MGLRSRLKLPKEHGAWAMLYVSLVIGALVAGDFSTRVVLLTLSVTFLFIARESVLAWWRGRRRSQQQPEALRVMLVYLTLAALFGAPLILVYHLYWLVPQGLVAAALLITNAEQAARREDRTIRGEMLAIIGLTLTAPAAYYVTRGAWDVTAAWLWVLCALYFASSIFYVKLRVQAINPRKALARRETWRRCAFYHTFLLGSLAVLTLTDSLNLFALAGFAPVLARSFWSLMKPAGQLRLRRIGVLEIVYSVVFLIFMTLTFRLA